MFENNPGTLSQNNPRVAETLRTQPLNEKSALFGSPTKTLAWPARLSLPLPGEHGQGKGGNIC
jgi:hypothetical protein